MQVLWAYETEHPQQTLVFTKPLVSKTWFRSLLSPPLLVPFVVAILLGWGENVVNYNINDVNKPRNPTAMVPAWYPPPPPPKKKKISLVLPYLGLQSKIIIKQLKACINIFYGCNDLRFIFQNTHRIKSLFPYKDRLNRSQISKELVVGTVRISTLAKPNGDCMIEKLNTSRQSSAHHQSTFPHFQS